MEEEFPKTVILEVPKKPKRPIYYYFVIPFLAVWVAGLAFGFWYVSRLSKTPLTSSSPSGPRIDPNYQPPTSSLGIILESPKEGVIITDGQLLVKGKTAPGAMVSVYTDEDEMILETDSSGVFEGKMEMELGINTLTVTAFAENGEEKSVYLDVVYDET